MSTNIAAYSSIINRLAFKFSNLGKIDPVRFSHEDLISEGWITLGILQKENPNATEEQMQSYLGQFFKQRLLNFAESTKMQVKGEMKYRPVPVEYTEAPEEDMPGQTSQADLLTVAHNQEDRHNTYMSLSTEAKEVVDIIFSAPAELLALAGKDVTLEHIKTYLNKHRGWSWNKIYKFWVEIGLSAH